MKTLNIKSSFLLALLLSATSLLAQQQLPTIKYDQLKSAGLLDVHANHLIISPQQNMRLVDPARYNGPVQIQSSVCNCLIPLDSTFLVAPFAIGTPPDYRNDDGSTGTLTLPFQFDFFGNPTDSIYINNNGSISFGSANSTFSANPFPDPTYSMIAPFWADVDTRDTGSGLVYYQITPTHLVVRWDHVGYFSSMSNMVNDFQLIITDGSDSILPPGVNVSFCYGDMQWTTGSASSGVGGFGGIPSTVGVNQGNGTDYFQVTRNDQAGMLFDGPYGNPDGVDWLDGQEIYFNTAFSGNVPPIVINSSICDTIDVFTGDTLRTMNIDSVAFDFKAMTPEPNQTLTVTFTTNAPAAAFSSTQAQSSGSFELWNCIFRAKHLPPGTYTVTATATDNGTPAETSSSTVYIHSYYDGTLGIQGPDAQAAALLYPNPTDGKLTIAAEGMKSLCISDMTGRIVFTSEVFAATMNVDLSNCASGSYLVTLVRADGTQQRLKLAKD